jgi:hypothetical protein
MGKRILGKRAPTLFALAAAFCVLAGFGDKADTRAPDTIKVEVTGTLTTGIMAIGGETTGTVIQAGNVIWELDFEQNAQLKARAKELSGKRVVVTGTYRRGRGVEIAQREIVTVTSLTSAE